MQYSSERRVRRRAAGAAVAVLALLLSALPTGASGQQRHQGKGGDRVVVCHERPGGDWKRVRISSGAVAAHVRNGGVVAGDAVPGREGRVFDQECGAVFSYADLATSLVNEVRQNVDPPCDSAAPDSPCGPENGGVLPPVSWDQELAALASVISDSCPIFIPRDLSDEAVHVNVYLHFSQTPVTRSELVELAIATWAAKAIQYDPITGAGLRPGDLIAQQYSSMLWADEVGISATTKCENNRSVAVMYMTPGHGDGPAYPPLLASPVVAEN